MSLTFIRPDVSDFHYTYEDDGEGNTVPVITLEVLSKLTQTEEYEQSEISCEMQQTAAESQEAPSDHFITEVPKTEPIQPEPSDNKEQEQNANTSKVRTDLLEYMIRNDGSVICKLCGEILQSRTHWYRHKYKLHVIPPLNPAPLYQCEQCLVFFKSRKG